MSIPLIDTIVPMAQPSFRTHTIYHPLLFYFIMITYPPLAACVVVLEEPRLGTHSTFEPVGQQPVQQAVFPQPHHLNYSLCLLYLGLAWWHD